MRTRHVVTLCVLFALVVSLVGCPILPPEPPIHVIVGNWMLRFKVYDSWLPYVEHRFYNDGTYEQISLTGRRHPGNWEIVSSTKVFARHTIGFSTYEYDLTVQGDDISGRIDMTPGTPLPVDGYRLSKDGPVGDWRP